MKALLGNSDPMQSQSLTSPRFWILNWVLRTDVLFSFMIQFSFVSNTAMCTGSVSSSCVVD